MRYQSDLSVRFLRHPGQVCYLAIDELRWMNRGRRDLGGRFASEVALPGTTKIKLKVVIIL